MTTRHRQLNIVIQRVQTDTGNPFDPFNAGQPTETVSRVWARREDSPVRNEVQGDRDELVAVNESRYTVRQLLSQPWAIGDFIVDEAGRRRRVTGVSQMQQHGEQDGRMVVLLVEGYGGL